MKMEEILAKSLEELRGLKVDLAKEIFELRNEKRIAQRLEKPHLISMKRRDIARIETALRQLAMHPEKNVQPKIAKEVEKKASEKKTVAKRAFKKKEEINE